MADSFERWVDKVAIVTGASVGIGAEIAKTLVGKGLKVVGLARRLHLMEDMEKKLSQEKGKFYPIKCDLTREEDIFNAYNWITETLGPVSILINNAGIGWDAPLTEGKTELWREVLDVNVLGLCVCTREALKDMKKNNTDGHIIHMNSISGHKVVNHTNIYCATKHAVTALTENLRLELKDMKSKIKITSISPGIVKTKLLEYLAFDKKLNPELPALNTEDIANAIVYVLSTPPHVQVHELIIKPIGESL